MKTKSISITNNWRGFEVIFRLHGVEPDTERVSSFIFTLCHYVGLAVRDDLSGGVRTCMLSIYVLFTGRKSYYFMPWFKAIASGDHQILFFFCCFHLHSNFFLIKASSGYCCL